MRRRDLKRRRVRARAGRPRPAPRFDWRDLPPIPLEDRIEVPATPSQTFLAWRDICHRAAYLYLRHRGGPGGHQLNRGTVFHVTVERLTNMLIASGQRTVDPDTAKAELDAVFAEMPELTVPAVERDYLRMLVYHWAVGFAVDPARVVGVEQMLTLELGRWTIRGKVDLIEQVTHDLIDLTDYKTQRNMPTSEEWHAGGYDDRGNPRFGGNYQTILYAVLAAYGRTPEGLRIGDNVNRWRLWLRFPAVLWDDGIGYKTAEVDRLMLANFRDDLAAQLAGLEHSIATGKWQPTPGSHCDRCPAEHECPLPRHLRAASQGAAIETLEQAETFAATWRFQQRRNKALKGAVRAFAERHNLELIYTGRDTALKFIPVDREGFKPRSLPKVREAIEGAAKYGHGLDANGDLDLSRFVTRSQSTSFDERKVPPKAAPESE